MILRRNQAGHSAVCLFFSSSNMCPNTPAWCFSSWIITVTWGLIVPEVCLGHRRAAATSAWPASSLLALDGGSWVAASRWESFSPLRSRREDPGRERQPVPEGTPHTPHTHHTLSLSLHTALYLTRMPPLFVALSWFSLPSVWPRLRRNQVAKTRHGSILLTLNINILIVE